MYNISSEFHNAMQQPAQKRRLYGTIGSKQFGQINVIKGSFVISNQCSNNSDIQIGQVYVGELKATFKNMDITSSSWQGKEIVAYQGLEISEGVWEDVLLGHYFIDDAKHTAAGVDITAYDIMSKFDKAINFTYTDGKLYNIISYICSICNVPLETTEEEILAMANGNEVVLLYTENDVETYRDLLSWCCQTLGANAYINRQGNLIIRQYNKEDVKDIIDIKQRLIGGSVSDFTTYYTGLSCVNIKEMTTSYYGMSQDDGLTMNLGQNPFMQDELLEIRERQRTAVLNAIQQIRFTPFKMKVSTPLIYDLMDTIELTGGLAGTSVKTTVTKYTWKFNGNYEIECSGSNPALANGRSKVDKNIAGLLDRIDATRFIIYKFVNAEDIELESVFKEIVSAKFASKEKEPVIFLAQVLFDVENPDEIAKEVSGVASYEEGGIEVEKDVMFVFNEKTHPVAEVWYKLNDEVYEPFTPKQVYHEGSQILTLYYPIMNVDGNRLNEFHVYMKIDGGNATIEAGNCIATVLGQGLAAEYTKWDGNLEFSDEVGLLYYSSNLTLNELDGDVEFTYTPRNDIEMSDDIPLFGFTTLQFDDVSDISSVEYSVILGYVINVNYAYNYIIDDEIFIQNNKFNVRHTRDFVSVEKPIDTGKMCELSLNVDDIDVESVVITVE